MDTFAKLFETEEHGQILVKLDTGDDGPEVRYYFQPKGFGVCSMTLGFKDTDKNWDFAEKVFTEITAEMAIKAVSAVKQKIDF